MSSIDEKFKKVIAETASPEETIGEDAATGDAAIKKGAVPPQKSDLKNSAVEVGGSTKEKPEGPDNVGAKAAAPVTATKDSTLQTKPSGASSSMPGALSGKIFDDVAKEGEAITEEEISEDITAILSGADLDEEFQKKYGSVYDGLKLEEHAVLLYPILFTVKRITFACVSLLNGIQATKYTSELLFLQHSARHLIMSSCQVSG